MYSDGHAHLPYAFYPVHSLTIQSKRYRHRYTGLYVVADLAKRLQKSAREKKKQESNRGPSCSRHKKSFIS